jgi:DNA-binding response OmpR family regulator
MSTVLVYSDDPRVRERVLLAVGRRPDPEMEPIDWIEAGDAGTVTRLVDAGGIDVCVLDAEAAPTGGMGISRALKNEVRDCPLMLLLVARYDDRWLARWSLADLALKHPADPVDLADAVVQLIKQRKSRTPVATSGGGLRRR